MTYRLFKGADSYGEIVAAAIDDHDILNVFAAQPQLADAVCRNRNLDPHTATTLWATRRPDRNVVANAIWTVYSDQTAEQMAVLDGRVDPVRSALTRLGLTDTLLELIVNSKALRDATGLQDQLVTDHYDDLSVELTDYWGNRTHKTGSHPHRVLLAQRTGSTLGQRHSFDTAKQVYTSGKFRDRKKAAPYVAAALHADVTLAYALAGQQLWLNSIAAMSNLDEHPLLAQAVIGFPDAVAQCAAQGNVDAAAATEDNKYALLALMYNPYTPTTVHPKIREYLTGIGADRLPSANANYVLDALGKAEKRAASYLDERFRFDTIVYRRIKPDTYRPTEVLRALQEHEDPLGHHEWMIVAEAVLGRSVFGDYSPAAGYASVLTESARELLATTPADAPENLVHWLGQVVDQGPLPARHSFRTRQYEATRQTQSPPVDGVDPQMLAQYVYAYPMPNMDMPDSYSMFNTAAWKWFRRTLGDDLTVWASVCTVANTLVDDAHGPSNQFGEQNPHPTSLAALAARVQLLHS